VTEPRGTVVGRQPGALSRRVDPAMLVLAPDRDDPVLLDGAAAVVWGRLVVPREVERLTTELAQEFSEQPTVAQTVADVVGELIREGLLVEQGT
jgi:hypothetical protein